MGSTHTTKPVEREGLPETTPVDLPLWRKIETELLAEIRDGKYRDEGRLPSEHKVAERFGVNRHTARRALAELVERGVLFKRKGGGSYLVPGVVDYEIGQRTRFSANLIVQQREPDHRIIAMEDTVADGRVGRALGLPETGRVAFVRTVGEADGIPVSVGEHYVPGERFPGFLKIYGETKSMTKTFERFGLRDYLRQVTRVVARLPSAADSALLMQSKSTPVLAVESIDVDPQGSPITYHLNRFAGERVQFIFGNTPRGLPWLD